MNKPVEIPLQVAHRQIEVHGAEGPLEARVYSHGANRKKADRLMVYFHGGGFVGGDLDEDDAFLCRLVQALPEYVLLSSHYTLAGEKPFPAAIEDAHAVLLWAKKNKARIGWSGKTLVVAGIEAGANLAAVCALISRDRGAPKLAGQVLIMPMLDPGLSTCSMREVAAGDETLEVANSCAASYRGYLPNAADRSHPYASPLQSSRLRNLPPALILSVEDDPLRDEAEQYGARLTSSGVSTTMKRLEAESIVDAAARSECACEAAVLTEISRFLATLDGPLTAS
ncbi:alpha/beta hydrolase [Massilia sp. RP-1-19]|uniref:Alpha/beta hydrolase n=1 Tax=Massilia polaris TaxID=2728846 RepID=A0A848HPP2_9BURK|nr:alpha/beta hydrolase [Massilia polaris]NML60548.1 alpha/beta hydrolase [Massilia polaris]